MQSIPFVPLAALGSAVFVFVNFLKYLTNRDWNAALTQATAWAAGIGAVCLFSNAALANGITVGTTTLARLDFWSQVCLGLSASSALSTFNEFKKAVDTSDTASTPPLLKAVHTRWKISRVPAAPATAAASVAPAPLAG